MTPPPPLLPPPPLQPRQPPVPVHPPVPAYTPNILRRLRRGLHSWLALLNTWDYRNAIGSLRVLGQTLVLVSDPALVRQVLVEQVDAFPKHPYTLWILEPLIGRAIFSVNGAEWERQRRLLDQAFQAAQLQRVFPQMGGAVAALLERLEAEIESEGESEGDAASAASTEGAVVEIDAAMTLVTADVIVRTLLSRPLGPQEAKRIFSAFARYQRRAGQALVLRLLRLPRRLLQHWLRRDAAEIRAWMAVAMAERRARGREAEDLLGALEAAVDPQDGGGFSPDDLLDQVCFLFLAGHETSASSLAMACYLLAQMPEVQARLHSELETLLAERRRRGGDPQAPLAYNDLRGLVWGTAVFQETLRLYPPVSFFLREARRESGCPASPAGDAPPREGANSAELRCPLGALVTISPWVIQRHTAHWPHPDGFRPERFLAASASPEERQWARDAYLPFGLGPRKCPGAAFALQEALLVLAELVRRYELLPAGPPEPELVGRLTLRSANGIRVRLRRRQPAG